MNEQYLAAVQFVLNAVVDGGADKSTLVKGPYEFTCYKVGSVVRLDIKPIVKV